MPYLMESVQSILPQTHRDFELLIVNDGSSDGSLEYLLPLRDSRIRLIHQENRGLTTTLNRMLADGYGAAHPPSASSLTPNQP